jgi:dihydroorotase
MTILLKNGHIVDRINNLDSVFDLLIKDGFVHAIGKNLNTDSANSGTGEVPDRVIDCTGLTVMPGIFDMHVHLRDPGQTHKEDLISGTNAAAAGGVTGLLCMPNTSPALDSPELVRDIIERSKECKVNVHVCAAITKGLQGEELTDFAALKEAGAVAVSDDGMPVVSDELMAAAMVEADKTGLTIISHCEPENEMTFREVQLAEKLDVPVHIAHVSTAEALSYVTNGTPGASCPTFEIAPHHFTLTLDDIKDADYKMNPPLRTQKDAAALIQHMLLLNDTLVIASDHAPHTPEEKADFDTAPNGVLGLETLLAVTLTELYHKHGVSLDRIVEMLCINPRRILGIPLSPDDLAVVDLNEEWTVEPDELKSKSKNTCFKGMKLKGRVKYTIVNGEVVYDGT